MPTSSRRVSGRTPLSLMSNSTRFSHVDCMRSISNVGIFIAVFGYIKVFHAEPGHVANGDAAGVPRGLRSAERADLNRALPLLRRVLQFSQLLTLLPRVDQQERCFSE